GTIKGRLEYKRQATSKITDSWGGRIVMAAPVLNVPFSKKVTETDANGKTIVSYKAEYAKFAPKELETSVNLVSQTRYIGIFEVPVFSAEMTMKGNFSKIEALSQRESGVSYSIKDAFLSLEINDLKGISVPDFMWNGKKYDFEPSVLGRNLSLSIPYVHEYSPKMSYTRYYENDYNTFLKSLSAPVNFDNQSGDFEIKFSIKGSESISFVPLAKNNSFRVYSKWTNPNFSGNFLPDNKEITKDGFSADWDINYMASGISQNLDSANLSSALFTTSLLIPVDNYRSAERATKYGILFIILTFMACFVSEITSKKPIHPFQYLLVGLAMAIFYILLVSISEFIPFGFAYLIASAAITSMITLYAKFGISKNLAVKQVVIIAASFAALYGYMYILLQLQDMALIFGSIGLFIGLSIVMYATRNITWYEEQPENK
ncbi:MAG: cell envelope integrity protein CreD, partial [Endomicrobium sp.]|nr:cell envelope integrity protein CreD [Endomicrobium sp.]